MTIPQRIAELGAEMTAWRRDLHAHPELGFEEHRTAQKVAALLEEFGCEVDRGIAGTGVVGACEVHHPACDFNDAALPYGASFFARLVERRLQP